MKYEFGDVCTVRDLTVFTRPVWGVLPVRMLQAYDIKDANKYRKRPVFKGISKKTTGLLNIELYLQLRFACVIVDYPGECCKHYPDV